MSLAAEREDLITGRRDAVKVGPSLRALMANATPDQTVFYGWPTIVLADRSGRMRIAPLVMTELEPPAPGQHVAVARDAEPFLNPGLLTDAFFSPDALAAVEALGDAELPFGDAQAMTRRIRACCDALGLQAHALDADRLGSGGPRGEGVHNVAMAFCGRSNLATLALIDELTELADRTDTDLTAARWLAAPGGAPAETTADDASTAAGLPPVAVSGLALNDAQEQALVSALSEPLTVVTGPPGTGKSQLVAAVVVNQWLAGRSVLVASTNNGAVDVAARRCGEIDEALLLRAGNRERREELPAFLERLAARGATPGPSGSVIRRQLEAAAAGRQQVLDRLAARTRLEADVAQLVLDVETLRSIVWGKPGMPAVHGRCRELGARAQRALRSRWRRRRLEKRLFAEVGDTQPGCSVDDLAAWADAEERLAALGAELERLGPADPGRDRAELERAAEQWARAGSAALTDTVQQRLHAGAAGLRQLARMRGAARAARTAAVARVLPCAPGWACTALSARHNFPLAPAVFDLLVLDEASQCSVAEALPLVYRARRVLVVGDPNQLTPVVTLAGHALDSVAAAAGTTQPDMRRAALSFGHDSAFTAFAARLPHGPELLDEHYRCHPDIARFFNGEFYGGALRVLTDVTKHVGAIRGFGLVDVPGATVRGRMGGACNEAEVEAIVHWARVHLDEPGTLGVVTPFAAQAELLRTRLTAALGPDVCAAKELTVGTAHRFQGDERDVMLFSTVLSSGVRDGTVCWVEEQRNLVNVAVSRARRGLVVFADVATIADVPVPTLRTLVSLAAGGAPAAVARDTLTDVASLHSEAEKRLFEALSRRGHVPTLKLRVDGYELDFAFTPPWGLLNIEVDGVHHTDVRGRQRRQDLARDHILHGLGWTVHRVPAWQCLSAPDATADALVRLIAAGVGVA